MHKKSERHGFVNLFYHGQVSQRHNLLSGNVTAYICACGIKHVSISLNITQEMTDFITSQEEVEIVQLSNG